MRLVEHPDFEQALLLAAADHGLAEQFVEQFVEKDYYVTEILRVIASGFGDKVMFKVEPASPRAGA